jgi:hypothetical protein
MSDLNAQAIEHFLHGQIDCWNRGDREGFLRHYREMSADGLSIEYVGRPTAGDAWAVLENMWAQQQPLFRVDVVLTVINGNEAACHHINRRVDGSSEIHTVELYRFEPGRLSVRYFIKA